MRISGPIQAASSLPLPPCLSSLFGRPRRPTASIFSGKYSRNCWFCLFEHFNLSWVFGNKFKENVVHLLIGPRLKSKPNLLWVNAVKAILSEIWFERNQRVFHAKASPWLVRFENAKLNASAWCSLAKTFKDFSISDICLNWKTFITPPISMFMFNFCSLVFTLASPQFLVIVLNYITS